MKRIFALLCCMCLLLAGCGDTRTDTLPIESVKGQTPQQVANLVFASVDTVAYQGVVIRGGNVLERYAVKAGFQEGNVALTSTGEWLADTQGDGHYRVVYRQGSAPVFGEELKDTGVAQQYLQWQGATDALSADDRTNIESLFDAVYLNVAEKFGKGSPSAVSFAVDTDSQQSYCRDGVVYISAKQISDMTDSYDVILPPLFCAVSGLSESDAENGTLIAGIGLYVRATYGLFAKDSLLAVDTATAATYLDSPTVAGSFLTWVSDTINWDFCPLLTRSLQAGTYSDGEDGVWYETIGSLPADAFNLFLIMYDINHGNSSASDWRFGR